MNGYTLHLMLPVPDPKVPCGSWNERNICNCAPTAGLGVLPGTLGDLGAWPRFTPIQHLSELTAAWL